MEIRRRLHELGERWAGVPSAERANYQLYLIELAEAMGVLRPQPKGSGYAFDYPIKVLGAEASSTTKFADLYRRGHFLLEAKDQDAQESSEILMRRAFAQARLYAAWIDGDPPPYLLVLDVGNTLMVWDRWKGTYGDFHSGHRIRLGTLANRPNDIALLRDIWRNPGARDPRGKAEAVTREIAERLAALAQALEGRGHEPEVVSRFLIRCVFTMFAEDIGLLPDEPFRIAIEDVGLNEPKEFEETVRGLWEAMDTGGRFGLRRYLRFNGHFFRDQATLPLTSDDLQILLEAEKADWSDVEPSIMGTLLTRALDPSARHRLGAEYTPREYVERLVRPAVEEPIRERWTRVQAEVLQLLRTAGRAESTQRARERKALRSLRAFHTWLRSLRFLDPACGSGNFLYVTLAVVKGVELEVIRAIEEITGAPEVAVEEVGPWQFYGIEVNTWARELAELTLWVGFHQWWRRTHGHSQPPEPVLRDTGTLELHDAVLAWDEIVDIPGKAKPDPTPRIPSPVTGDLVPDPEAVIPYLEYRGASRAEWPRADFIIGNPPYMGSRRKRMVLGEGYTDALNATYPEVPDGADYVMLWWFRAAEEIRAGRTIRAGLITTNSITQPASRRVVEAAEKEGVRLSWAIADHPWVDETMAADVRVAMTVLQREPDDARLVTVDEHGHPVSETRVPRLNGDLSIHANVAEAAKTPLVSNRGLAFMGVKLVGQGFVLDEEEAADLLAADPAHSEVVRPYLAGRDLVKKRRSRWVIDFGLMSEDEARGYPVLYDIVRDRVKPGRDANKGRYKTHWWQFGRANAERREAAGRLGRVIATVEVSKHSYFTFISTAVVPDGTVITIATDEGWHLGVLSSTIHESWALAAGGRLGVGNDPRYSNSLTFDPFPFPSPDPELRAAIAQVMTAIERHRTDALDRSSAATPTEVYNVVAKLRGAETLTEAEKEVHRLAACGTLSDLHEQLDRLVSMAYGWKWPLSTQEILARLEQLHGERLAEEARGKVRWLRADYQEARFSGAEPARPELDLSVEDASPEGEPKEWPGTTLDQIAAIQELLTRKSATVDEVARSFRGARRDIVSRHLETLALMGEVMESGGSFELVRPTPSLT